MKRRNINLFFSVETAFYCLCKQSSRNHLVRMFDELIKSLSSLQVILNTVTFLRQLVSSAVPFQGMVHNLSLYRIRVRQGGWLTWLAGWRAPPVAQPPSVNAQPSSALPRSVQVKAKIFWREVALYST